MVNRWFITGTDTGVGKTLATTALLVKIKELGHHAIGLKPVAAGYEKDSSSNGDALLIQRYSSVQLTYEQHNPVLLPDAVAPHLSAARQGVALDAQDIVLRCETTMANYPQHVFLLEGAGGWQVPLNGYETMADIVAPLNCSVILVVGMRLGCLNHALLTVASIAHMKLPLAGWIANGVSPAQPLLAENLMFLKERLAAPCLGIIPHLTNPTPEVAASYLADTGVLFDN